MNVKDCILEYLANNYPANFCNNIDFSEPFRNLGIDSIDLFEIVMYVEGEFDITIEDELIDKFKNLNDLISAANRKMVDEAVTKSQANAFHDAYF